MKRPTPITRGSTYRTPAGIVRATIDRGDTWFGRLIGPDGIESDPVHRIPPDAPLVTAYQPRAVADVAVVADPLVQTTDAPSLALGTEAT